MIYENAIKVMQDAKVPIPALVKFNGEYHCFTGAKLLGSGRSYEAALTAAKLLPRKERTADTAVLFVNKGRYVFHGNDTICEARSVTTAHRIANALNIYEPPTDRGF